jgi:hypothetical protein
LEAEAAGSYHLEHVGDPLGLKKKPRSPTRRSIGSWIGRMWIGA